MKINFALVGQGTISRYFIQAIKKNRNTRLVAVCDVNKNKKNINKNNGVCFYHQLDDLLAREDIEAVVVAAPNRAHFEIVNSCLMAGKHILCEKPLGVNFAQTKAMVSMASKKKLLLMTAFHRKYNRYVLDLQSKNQGSEIQVIHARYLEDINKHTSCTNWKKFLKNNGGGCVIDNGVNVINVVQNIVGNLKLKHVYVGYKGIRDNKYDSNAYLEFKFNQNGVFNLELDWEYSGEVKDLTVYYKDGKVKYVNFLKNFKQFKSSLNHEYDGVINNFIYLFKIRNFRSDIQSLKAMKLIDEIFKNANGY